MLDIQKISHSSKCATTVWRVIPLEIHFFVDTAFGYSNNQRELYYKMWSSKSSILRTIDIYGFFYSNFDNLH